MTTKIEAIVKRLPLDFYLWEAVSNGQAQDAMTLIVLGANQHQRWKKHYNRPLLTMAADDGYADTVRVLVKAGVKINAKDDEGNTALMMAVGYMRDEDRAKRIPLQKEIVQVLMATGADWSIANKRGYLPLNEIVSNNYPTILSMVLLEGVPDIDMVDGFGRTVLDEANWDNRHAMAKLIKQHGGTKAPKTKGQDDG